MKTHLFSFRTAAAAGLAAFLGSTSARAQCFREVRDALGQQPGQIDASLATSFTIDPSCEFASGSGERWQRVRSRGRLDLTALSTIIGVPNPLNEPVVRARRGGTFERVALNECVRSVLSRGLVSFTREAGGSTQGRFSSSVASTCGGVALHLYASQGDLGPVAHDTSHVTALSSASSRELPAGVPVWFVYAASESGALLRLGSVEVTDPLTPLAAAMRQPQRDQFALAVRPDGRVIIRVPEGVAGAEMHLGADEQLVPVRLEGGVEGGAQTGIIERSSPFEQGALLFPAELVQSYMRERYGNHGNDRILPTARDLEAIRRRTSVCIPRSWSEHLPSAQVREFGVRRCVSLAETSGAIDVPAPVLTIVSSRALTIPELANPSQLDFDDLPFDRTRVALLRAADRVRAPAGVVRVDEDGRCGEPRSDRPSGRAEARLVQWAAAAACGVEGIARLGYVAFARAAVFEPVHWTAPGLGHRAWSDGGVEAPEVSARTEMALSLFVASVLRAEGAEVPSTLPVGRSASSRLAVWATRSTNCPSEADPTYEALPENLPVQLHLVDQRGPRRCLARARVVRAAGVIPASFWASGDTLWVRGLNRAWASVGVEIVREAIEPSVGLSLDVVSFGGIVHASPRTGAFGWQASLEARASLIPRSQSADVFAGVGLGTRVTWGGVLGFPREFLGLGAHWTPVTNDSRQSLALSFDIGF